MKKKNSSITIFAILTTITLFAWVLVEAYQHFYNINIQTVPDNIIAPLTPTLDTSVLDDISTKKKVTQDEINLYKGPVTTQASTKQITSSQSATPKQNAATTSGETR